MYNKPNDKLIIGCSAILENYSNSSHHSIRLLPNNEFYSLACKNAIYINNDGKGFSVARFKSNSMVGFSFSLKFNMEQISEKRRKYNLTDANLKVFYINDQLSQLLFRAEFSINKSDKKHAQPHWQFEPYITKALKESDFETVIQLRSEEIQLLDNDSETEPFNISKLHFAMSSDWCKPKREQITNSHVSKISEENTLTWLEGCLEYINDQLD